MPKFNADQAKAAELEPAFGAYKAAWDNFSAAEPDLSAALLAECRSALSSIERTD